MAFVSRTLANPRRNVVGPRQGARAVDRAKAQAIADSIREIGLLSPIIVAPGTSIRNGQAVDGWDILAGQHRFRAMHVVLGWEDIPCVIYAGGDLHAELVMIDENLARQELSDAERARQLCRRKEIYEALHPEAAMGASQAAAMNRAVGRGRQNGDDVAERFTKDAARLTGKSERSVQRDVALGDSLTRIKGTSLDRGA